ncbi:Uncharacterized protein DAT39_017162 [Clarias magur]|uniref:Uncharacterized protein n=1 Tax=Clarias magur TaxID=1594786 RepID=A0A8J4WVV1_CLAMG|nr:Uncharacterized protein DAT39_017162 [Clarias magur]
MKREDRHDVLSVNEKNLRGGIKLEDPEEKLLATRNKHEGTMRTARVRCLAPQIPPPPPMPHC